MQMPERGVVGVEGGARDVGVAVRRARQRPRRAPHRQRERARADRGVAGALKGERFLC